MQTPKLSLHRNLTFFAFAIAVLISLGCSHLPLPKDCSLAAEDIAQVVAEVQAVADQLSTDLVNYKTTDLLEQGQLFRDGDRCWTYLLIDSTEQDINMLEGAGGVYVDPETLEIGPVTGLQ